MVNSNAGLAWRLFHLNWIPITVMGGVLLLGVAFWGFSFEPVALAIPTAIAAALMDGPAALRHYMIDTFVVEGFTFDEVMNDEEAMEAFVRKAAIGVWHASCSCRMGRPDDPMTVVDTQGRVKGIQGLRVVDASIFPVVPCANTNFPTLMAAEKIAEAMQ